MKDNKMRASIARNPVLVLFLGACPAMASTGKVLSALGMGLAVLLVLLGSGVLIAALRRVIPERARIGANVVIIAGVASVVQLLMHALLPSVYQMLGVYLAVTAVSLLAFHTAENSCSVGAAALDSLITGLLFTLALFVMAAVRELFGLGSFAGMGIPFLQRHTIATLTQAHGGFVVFAILIAVIHRIWPAQSGAETTGFACAAAGISSTEHDAQGE